MLPSTRPKTQNYAPLTQYPPVFGTQEAPQGQQLAHAHNFPDINRTQTKSCLFKDQYIFCPCWQTSRTYKCAATCTLVQNAARYIWFKSFYFPFSLVVLLLLLLQQRETERGRQRERESETERGRQTERETERETERKRQRERDRERCLSPYNLCCGIENMAVRTPLTI